MNEEDWEDTPIMCTISFILIFGSLLGIVVFGELIDSTDSILIKWLLTLIGAPIIAVGVVGFYISWVYACIDFY